MLYITIKLIHTLNTLLLRLFTRNWKMKLDKIEVLVLCFQHQVLCFQHQNQVEKNAIGKFEPKFDIYFKGMHFKIFFMCDLKLNFQNIKISKIYVFSITVSCINGLFVSLLAGLLNTIPGFS